MKIAQYLHTSMFGSYWTPCEVIGENEEGQKIIRYVDLALNTLVEKEVDNEYLRSVNVDISSKYIKNAATQTALTFKTDLLIIDEERLSDIAGVVEKALMQHFNYPK